MFHLSRREVLRYGAAAAAVVASAVTAQSLTTGSSAAQPPAAASPNPDPRDFELVYLEKKIQGVHGGAHNRTTEPHQVHIDGRKLAVMQVQLPAAGTSGVAVGLISALNHYEPVLIDGGRNKDGLLKLARRAVDTLGDNELTTYAGAGHDHGR